MNIAIIDVGSNNIKLEIHHVDSHGNHELLLKEKVPARLGHQVFITRKLAKQNVEEALEGLKHFAKLIKAKQCKKVIALGTAALREAEAASFLKQVQKKTGISIQVISGVEEARLVYQGVRGSTSLGEEKFLLIDIGGGSTEISIADGSKPYFLQSLRLGTVRLKELFDSDDKNLSRKLMEKYIDKVVEPFLQEILSFGVKRAILTGGTARNVASIIKEKWGKVEEKKGLTAISPKEVSKLADYLHTLQVHEIETLPGLDPQRADIITEGTILLAKLLESFRIKEALVSPRGLRDGALVDYIERKLERKFYKSKQKDIRKEAIFYLCKKYHINKKHAKQCANIAISLFEKMPQAEKFPDNAKDILYGAAYLHDIGLFINYSEHHKHSYYIIENTDIPGYTPKEKHLLALVSRYHRKSAPKKSHSEHQALSTEEQDLVYFLAAILRIAIALDKSAKSVVEDVDVITPTKEEMQVLLYTGGKDCTLELWDVQRKKKMLQKYLGMNIDFKVALKP
ncbi:MAG: Ppx/GppA family phosphatase [Candidatus Hydrogenedentota bacterium]|nr:MAG: Ppx/GppA family phosphatase [Candidatus Hydrogenedentota bacterium]